MLWKKWKRIKKGDYIYALIKEHPNATINGYVLEHRIIIENKLNRLLKKNEVVHHKDNNRHNNHINNLELLKIKDHCIFHGEQRKNRIKIRCYHCNKEFELKNSQYKKRLKYNQNIFCSHACSGKVNGLIKKPIDNIIIKELKKGKTGYQISKEQKICKGTVYNHIKKIEERGLEPLSTT